MSFRRRALFLAGLFVAVSCSDAGNPVSPAGPLPGPDAASDALLQAFICSVDASGRHACVPESPQLGEVPGAISIGNVNYASLVTSNLVDGPTTRTVDVALVNHIQTLGTLDGVTPHSYGIRIWVEPPFLLDTIVPGQPTSVAVSNADGTMTWAAAYPNRPYFQYPGLLPTGDTTIAKTWAFSKQNVNTFSYRVFVATEVQFPKGWIDITPTTPVIEVGAIDTLAAAVRGPYGNLHTEKTGLTWTSSNPSIVTVAELSPRHDRRDHGRGRGLGVDQGSELHPGRLAGPARLRAGDGEQRSRGAAGQHRRADERGRAHLAGASAAGTGGWRQRRDQPGDRH